MDSRAKQRLTGAVILVALIVLLVPELLTGPREAHPPADGGSEAGLRQYTIDLDSQERGPAKPAAPDNSSVALPPVAPMNATPQLAQPGEAAAPEGPSAPATNPMAPPVAANNVAGATSAPAARPAAATTSPEARTEAPRASNTERGTFVVQLGSFASRANADQLVRDMTAKGFTAFVAPITSKGRELFRVRVGPVRDLAAAEALAAQLKQAGQSGAIVPIS